MVTETDPKKVTKEDILNKARAVEEAMVSTQETAKTSATWIAAGVVAVVLVAFMLGRRRGKSGGAVVEVYKV